MNGNCHEAFLSLRRMLESRVAAAYRRKGLGRDLDDAVQEGLSLGWYRFRCLWDRGTDARTFDKLFVNNIVRELLSGRRLAGRETDNDVLSWRAQLRGAFQVCRCPDNEGEGSTHWLDAFADPGLYDVADQAAFRIDWQEWLDGRSAREQRVIDWLAAGHKCNQIADRLRKQPWDVSAIRRELRLSWQQYAG